MAKDPAILFYTQDFFVGTFSMTNEQVGKYIRLLCLQHQKNELEMNDMLNICQTYDRHVFSKFFKTTRGTFYNKRLRETMEKRKMYSLSRRNNRLSSVMSTHMENENSSLLIKEKDVLIKEKKEKIYHSFDHLFITETDHNKLLESYTQQRVVDVYDRIQNYKLNTKYKSLYLTAKNWLKAEKLVTNQVDVKPVGRDKPYL